MVIFHCYVAVYQRVEKTTTSHSGCNFTHSPSSESHWDFPPPMASQVAEAVESTGSFNGLHRNGDAKIGIQREHENDDQGSPSPNHNTKNEEIQYQSRLKGGIYGYYNRIIGISHLRFSVNLNVDITNQLHRAHFPPRLLSSSGSCVRIWSERRWLSILVELCTGTGQS